jgi:hypothetical protein
MLVSIYVVAIIIDSFQKGIHMEMPYEKKYDKEIK